MQRRKSRRRHPPSLAWLCFGILIFSYGCPALEEICVPAGGDTAMQRQLERINDRIGSPEYAAEVSWDEHVVLSYRLARDRDPTEAEFEMLHRLRYDPGIDREGVLILALGGAAEEERLANARRFLAVHDASEFRPDPSVTAEVMRLMQPSAELVKSLEITAEEARQAAESQASPDDRTTTSEPGVAYQTYFGFLHAHSHLSDGEGTALEAYEFARDQGGLDFFGLTDHGELLFVSWPCNDKWERLVAAAEATYAPGSYVTFWGFEWSNPLLGHVNILQSVDFTHTLARIRMVDLYEWLVERPQAFARFNHPGRFGLEVAGIDVVRELDHLDLHPPAVPQMVGLEVTSKDDGFQHFYYEGRWGDDPRSFLDVGLQKGWQLSPVTGQDNHQREWGTRNDFRTAVLAEELTRESILDAYTKRRVYATEDKDLFLDFRASGFPMGSRLTGVAAEFEISARDGSGDGFERVRLLRNSVEIESRAVNGNPVAVTFTDTEPTGADYYYVIVTQSDDGDGDGRNDEAISSPIWIDRE